MVIFCGSGATAAINKLVDVLNIRVPAKLDDRYNLSQHIPADERPVVFIGPYEHHSNELPWRESIADVVTIDENSDGQIDLEHLERELQRFQDRPLKIGSFSAASNVTGIGSKTGKIAMLLHRYGALSFWDFAAAGPYVEIEMNMTGEGEFGHLAYKDAIFISPHKFIGGLMPQGFFVAKKHLFTNRVPAMPGGGTVSYVNGKEHRYLDCPIHREEGVRPTLLVLLRGLIFPLKESGSSSDSRCRRVVYSESDTNMVETPKYSNLEESKILAIVDCILYDPRWRAISSSYNFVVAVLNDLFGIQARGGCSCTGPYGHRLLGIDLTTSHAFEQEVLRGCEGIKPDGLVKLQLLHFGRNL